VKTNGNKESQRNVRSEQEKEKNLSVLQRWRVYCMCRESRWSPILAKTRYGN